MQLSSPRQPTAHKAIEDNQLVLRHKIDKARATSTCSICHRTMLKRTLQRHIRSMHSLAFGQLPDLVRCDECDETFGRRDNLERHVLTQHEQKDDLVECLTCGTPVRERSLREHYKSRKCQSALQCTASEQRMEMIRAWQTNACSLDDLLRFAPESVLNPFTVASDLCIRFKRYVWFYKANSRYPIEYLGLRGLALRTVSRNLDDQYMRDSGCLEGAIAFLVNCDLDSYMTLERNTLWNLFDPLKSLHSTSPRTRLARSNDAHVEAAYRRMSIRLRTSEAVTASFLRRAPGSFFLFRNFREPSMCRPSEW